MSLAAAAQLQARVLRDGADLRAEYPLVFGAGAPGRVLALGDERRVLCAATLLERVLVCAEERVRVGLLGSVATEPEARGRGLATRVLDAGVAELAARGAVCALLWADEPGFYERRGWCAVGAELDLRLERDALEALPAPRGRVRPVTPADATALWALERASSPRVERSAQELAAQLATPAMRTLALEREGVLVAWIACGRGADFQGVVHDGGGAPRERLALVALLAREDEHDALALIAPASRARDWLAVLPPSTGASIGTLALARLADRDAARALVAARLPDARLRQERAALLVGGPRGLARVDDATLLRLLLPPRDERDAHAALAAATGLEAERLTLDAFVGGLDSI